MSIRNNMLILLFTIIINISARSFDCPHNNSAYLPVALPTNWIHGSSNCLSEGAQQPKLDIFSVNNDTFILRENKCINYEAPFMYLLFGKNIVLLFDSGATVSSTSFPIQEYVEKIILEWCIKNKKQREDLELIVAHTHNHHDHTAGDSQFQFKPLTTVVGNSVEEVSQFFQLTNWPNLIATYPLDNQRHLAIIPIPGHEDSAIAIYDCATALLLTGDTLYPGRLYISNFSSNVHSISRLTNFIKTNNLNITAILGTHIEMTQENKVDYPMGTSYQPKERQLHMSLEHLYQLNNELQQQWKDGFHRRHKAYYDTFIVDPNASELPLLPANGRKAKHRFTLMPVDRLNYVWMSYKPMFHTLLDFQLVFLATIDRLPLSINITKLNSSLTIESDPLSLNNLINGNLSLFQARLYTDNEKQDKRYLGNMTINIIHPFLTIMKLNSLEIEPYQPLRYLSYLRSNLIKSQIHLYLLHQIRVQPDFDAIVHVIIDPMNCTTDIERNQLNSLLEQNGNEWAFPGLKNDIHNRLTSTSRQVLAQLLGDIYSTVCTMKIVKEIQCRFFSHYQKMNSNQSQKRDSHYPWTVCDEIDKINHKVNTQHRNQDKYFHGIMPIWTLILLGVAIIFVIIFIAGLIYYLVARRTGRQDLYNNIHPSNV